MTLSPRPRWLLRLAAHGARPRRHLRAAGSSSCSTRSTPTARSPGRRRASRCSGGRRRGTARARATRCGLSVKVGLRRHRDRAGARHDGGLRGAAVPVLRPRHGLAAGHPADRAARHRHRHRAEQRLPDGARPLGIELGLFTVDRRARDVLHRRRSSTTCWPGCAGSAATSRRPRPTSAPTRSRRSGYVTFPLLRSALLAGGAAGLRAVLRRDHRDHVHRGPGRADAADLDLQQPVPAQPGAGRQRRRRGADRAVHRADLAGRSGSGWARAPAAASRRHGGRLQAHFVPVTRRTRCRWRRVRRLRSTKWVWEGVAGSSGPLRARCSANEVRDGPGFADLGARSGSARRGQRGERVAGTRPTGCRVTRGRTCSVPGTAVTLNRWSRAPSRIVASSMAKCSPTQPRGPPPNGNHA